MNKKGLLIALVIVGIGAYGWLGGGSPSQETQARVAGKFKKRRYRGPQIAPQTLTLPSLSDPSYAKGRMEEPLKSDSTPPEETPLASTQDKGGETTPESQNGAVPNEGGEIGEPASDPGQAHSPRIYQPQVWNNPQSVGPVQVAYNPTESFTFFGQMQRPAQDPTPSSGNRSGSSAGALAGTSGQNSQGSTVPSLEGAKTLVVKPTAKTVCGSGEQPGKSSKSFSITTAKSCPNEVNLRGDEIYALDRHLTSVRLMVSGSGAETKFQITLGTSNGDIPFAQTLSTGIINSGGLIRFQLPLFNLSNGEVIDSPIVDFEIVGGAINKVRFSGTRKNVQIGGVNGTFELAIQAEN